jgi:hypothetical protein
MAIILNDNTKINAGKPSESRYLSTGNTAYVSTGATNIAIPVPLRYAGLTVNILGTEYWYKDGVNNINLIEKKYDTVIPSGDFVTGATNIGFFSGFTGVQILPIDYVLDNSYNGLYYSLYNNYYRDINGIITIGISTDGIPKRGYVKTTSLVKSWIWNEYIGSGNQLGWILIDGNISEQIGTFQNGVVYYPPSISYIQTSWITGTAPNNGSSVIFSSLILGSLTTGITITIGAPTFAEKVGRVLEFRSIITKTPDTIGVSYNEAFIYLSGTSANATNGLTRIGNTIKLGGTLTGITTITDGRNVTGRTGIEYGGDYSATYSSRSLVDKRYVDNRNSISGERITKRITQFSHGFATNEVIGWSGGTYNKSIADGTYNGEVIGIINKIISPDVFDLTQAGYVTGLTGLTTNTTYFLSDITAGLLTSVEPTTDSHISKAVIIADSNTSAWVLPYAGVTVSSGSSVGGPLIRSACLPTTSTYQMTSFDFYVGACCGTLIILPLSPPTGMVAVIADISCCASGAPITIAGPLTNGQVQSQINSDSGSLSYIFNGNRWSVFAFIDTPVPV